MSCGRRIEKNVHIYMQSACMVGWGTHDRDRQRSSEEGKRAGIKGGINMNRKLIALALAAYLAVPAFGVQAAEAPGDAELSIAYQYGLGYAPVTIAQQLGLIEKAYEETTGSQLTITWNQMNSGADINTGIVSGDLDAGFMGVGPALTGISQDLGYKIFSNLSGQEHGIMTNNEAIQSFDDLVGSDYQIALVNLGSIQHILLAKALDAKGYDPHALDSNIVAMKHPDGMSALVSGAVAVHLTTNPYLFQEREEDSLTEIESLSEVCPAEDSFLVGIASEKIYEENPALYEALVKGISDGMDYLNDHVEEAAEITAEYDGNELEKEIEYLKQGYYSPETKGIEATAQFMFENGFLEKDPGSYENLVFDNVKGN